MVIHLPRYQQWDEYEEILYMLKFSQLISDWINNPTLRIDYEPIADILWLYMIEPTSYAVVHYVDEDFALLFDDESEQVIGLQIENFLLKFVAPELKRLQGFVSPDYTVHPLTRIRNMLFDYDLIRYTFKQGN